MLRKQLLISAQGTGSQLLYAEFLGDPMPSRFSEAGPQIGIFHECEHTLRHAVRILRIMQEAVLTMSYKIGDAPHIARHYGQAKCHGFHNGVGEAFHPRRQEKYIRTR